MAKSMSNTNKHGGKRVGAGRRQKWSYWFKFKVGQECEVLFRQVKAQTLEEEQKRLLIEQSSLNEEYARAQDVDVEHRAQWIELEDGGNQYLWDFESEIEQLNILHRNPLITNRLFHLRTRPPRGTRIAIIKQLALKYSLSENQVDNFWQLYSRFERDET